MLAKLLVCLVILLVTACMQRAVTTTDSGLQNMILKEGNGVPARKGDEVLIHESLHYMNDLLLFDSRT